MEEERIETMRNMIWVFSNLVSDLCCHLDNSCEQIRQVAEKCSEDTDIRDFAKQKSTCKSPLQQILYQPCGSNGISPQNHSPSASRSDLLNQSLPPLPNGSASHVYEVGEEPGVMFTALYDYVPQSSDEMELHQGDRIKKIAGAESVDGWIKGLNLRTKHTGLVPVNYIEN